MTREERAREDEQYRTWTGSYRPYDLIREASIALGVVLALVILLAILFSSPDERPTTIQSWSKAAPIDFVSVATSELDGSSATAGYGPPYNTNGEPQQIAGIRPANWFGVTYPIDTAKDYVILPLMTMTSVPGLQSAVTSYASAPASQQSKWTTAYNSALAKATARSDGTVTVPGTSASFGPVATMMTALLADAQAGGLDGKLLTTKQFYQTDYTKILMLLQDDNGDNALANGGNLPASANPGYFFNRAATQNLLGNQWGMMNETGSYPGQVWLWLYTFWYQIKPFSTSANADILVMAVMGILSLAFILVPFIPVVNRIPRWIPIYKLIWREHYRSLNTE
jgi:hypothetical protein